MKIVAFSEGARDGNAGIVSVATIHSSTAVHGHSIVLIQGGAPTPGREKFVVPDIESALARKQGNGTFGAICVKASGRWSFCPSILWRCNKLVRDADFVTLHSLYTFPVLAGYLLARIYRKPYGIWPHGVLAPFQRLISVRKKWLYDKLIARRILQNAAVIFFSARGERDETAPLGLRAPSVIIPDGFDAEEFDVLPAKGSFRKRFLKGHQGPLVLFLARLNAKKGLDLLISAMGRVVAKRPDAQLAIVGPPDPLSFNTQVMQWIREAGIGSNVVVTGPADPAMRLQAFADAEIYALPSHAENFGFSVFEAMACGVPVVVSETLNYAAEIAQSGAGLALPRTIEDFASAIIDLIERPEAGQKMGLCGRQFARTYSLEETGAKIAKTVERILQQRPFPDNVIPMMGRAASRE